MRCLFSSAFSLLLDRVALFALSIGLLCPSSVYAASVQTDGEASVSAASEYAAPAQSTSLNIDNVYAAASLLGGVTPGSVSGCTPPSMSGIGVNSSNQSAPQLGQYLAPGISLGEFYSDNINLAPEAERRADYATVLTPTLGGCTVGSRLRATFHYSGQAIHYARSTPHNKTYSQFKGAVISDLYDDHLFLDSNASYGQAVINPSAAYSGNNVFITTENRTNAWIYSLSPYWKQSLGVLGLATLRYRYGRVVYADASLYSSQRWTKSFNLTSQAASPDWSWTLHWTSSRVRYDRIAQTQYFDDAYLQLGYRLFYNLQLLAKSGVETDYQPDGSVKRYGGHYASGGFRLVSPNSSLLVMYGHRYFGHTWTVQSTYRTPSLLFTVGYDESTSIEPLLQTSQLGTQATSLTPLNNLQITNAFVDKRTSGDVTYLMSHGKLSLSAYDDWRYFRPKSLGHTRSTGGAVFWEWQYDSLTTLNASFNRARYLDSQSLGATNYVNRANIGITRFLQPGVKLIFDLGRQSSRSAIASYDYVANSALLQLSATF